MPGDGKIIRIHILVQSWMKSRGKRVGGNGARGTLSGGRG